MSELPSWSDERYNKNCIRIVIEYFQVMAKHRGFTFPHIASTPKAIQPDYSVWDSVHVGMTRSEVTALLGKPLTGDFIAAPKKNPYWYYGYIQFPLAYHPLTYAFVIGFDADDRVFIKWDPFDGRFSTDGKPTKPEIIIPVDGSTFRHYPRVVDMRWFPCSGMYPMRYVVEVGFRGCQLAAGCFGEWVDEVWDNDLPFPFNVHNFVGDSSGRFRVKARNALGEGPWSEYRYFTFDH